MPFNGIFINNQPCDDFSQIAVIENTKTVDLWMQEEEEAAAAEEVKKLNATGKKPKPGDAAKAKAGIAATNAAMKIHGRQAQQALSDITAAETDGDLEDDPASEES